MNGPHDLGGAHGYGEIPIEEEEAVFHSEWESKVFAMSFATFGNFFPVDETRHAAERIPPGKYLSSSYYERWLEALELLVIEHDLVSREEIDRRVLDLAQKNLAQDLTE